MATTLNAEIRVIKNLVKFMCQEFEVSKVTPAHNLARMCNQLKRQLVQEIYIYTCTEEGPLRCITVCIILRCAALHNSIERRFHRLIDIYEMV